MLFFAKQSTLILLEGVWLDNFFFSYLPEESDDGTKDMRGKKSSYKMILRPLVL